MMDRWYGSSPEKLTELARLFGVSATSLDALGVGWNGCCWAIPERSPSGMITDISMRAVDGAKWMVTGGRRGLVYADGFVRVSSHSILIVEGMSDTAAAMTLGLAAIGRPSNCTGGKMLAELLRGWQGKIIVMGENDRREPKPIPGFPHRAYCNGCQRCWPGQYGMMVVAKALRKTLIGRSVLTRFPPKGAKDLRSWANGAIRDPENAVACAAVGQSLLRQIGVR